jgi:hypothetical protein
MLFLDLDATLKKVEGGRKENKHLVLTPRILFREFVFSPLVFVQRVCVLSLGFCCGSLCS